MFLNEENPRRVVSDGSPNLEPTPRISREVEKALLKMKTGKLKVLIVYH